MLSNLLIQGTTPNSLKQEMPQLNSTTKLPIPHKPQNQDIKYNRIQMKRMTPPFTMNPVDPEAPQTLN